MPRSLLRIWIWILASCLNRKREQTEKLPEKLGGVQRSYRRFRIFSDRCIGHISFVPKKKKNSGRLSICWFMHDENRVKISPPNSSYWAGHGQSSALATPRLAQLVRTWYLGRYLLPGTLLLPGIQYTILPYYSHIFAELGGAFLEAIGCCIRNPRSIIHHCCRRRRRRRCRLVQHDRLLCRTRMCWMM